MKFRSVTGEDVHIALTTGHSAVVTAEGVELDKRFHKDAIALGCLPEGVEPDAAEAPTGFNRAEHIAEAMRTMLDGAEESDFTKDGKPDLRRLNAKAGFQVSRSEADAIWERVSAED